MSGSASELRSGIAQCEVIRPSGIYIPLLLELNFPANPQNPDRARRAGWKWTYVGGLRDGRMAVSNGIGLREPGGWLEFKDGKLHGTFFNVAMQAEIGIGATLNSDGMIVGSGKVGETNIAVSGRYWSSERLTELNAIPADLAWPAAQGPLMGGCGAQWTGVPTIDQLADIRMVWRCEEHDIGRGMGNIDRFMLNYKSAISRRTGSGSASPIAADGRIFIKYFVPTPRPQDVAEATHREYGKTEKNAQETMLTQARAEGFKGESLPEYALEKTYQCADDIVLCMDAATGATLWKAVVKARGINSQHHKAGPFDMSPAYGAGKVFALGMSGWIYAFDARSGEPLWEVKSVLDLSNALLVAGAVLVGPAGNQWGGYDVHTGKLLWKAGKSRNVSTLSAWKHNDRYYLIGRDAPDRVVCLDALTGQEIWTLPIKIITGGRGLGPGGITIANDLMLVYRNEGTVNKGEPLKPALAVYQLNLEKPEQRWELAGEPGNDLNLGVTHGESVPVVVRGKFVFTPDLRVLDLKDGKVLSRTTGPQPRNGGYMQAVEDLVLVRVDGTHGSMQCGWYKVAADGTVKSLTEEQGWHPPIGGSTTSYHHPIYYPAVAGRIFFRQDNGVYCWDLRKAANGE